MKNINIQLYQTNYIWFETEDVNFENNNLASISSNFDYEKQKGNNWRLYIDIGIKMSSAYIMVRSCFKLKQKDISWDDIFEFEILCPLVSIAINKSYNGFIEKCR